MHLKPQCSISDWFQWLAKDTTLWSIFCFTNGFAELAY